MLDRTADPERIGGPERGPEPQPDGGAEGRQPIFNIPWPIMAALGLLFGIHALRQIVPEGWDDALFVHLAFVPGRFTYAVAPDRVVGALVAVAQHGAEGYRQAQAERFFLGDGSPEPWTALSYALLHADWAHVGLNGIWLLAFGTPVARRLGAGWLGAGLFFAFLAAGAAAGAAVQWAAQPFDLAPVIGASAAVSACMGATLRFMFQPRGPVAAMVGAEGVGVGNRRPATFRPAQPLREVLRDNRALTFLVAWFATNLLFGLGSIPLGLGGIGGTGGGAIAWQAHIGGFLAGLLLLPFFDPSGRAPSTDPADLAPSAPTDPAAGL